MDYLESRFIQLIFYKLAFFLRLDQFRLLEQIQVMRNAR
ncbi:MAG: hypothetical protein RLZ73_1222, partial [Bacteroidota bacterium]